MQRFSQNQTKPELRCTLSPHSEHSRFSHSRVYEIGRRMQDNPRNYATKEEGDVDWDDGAIAYCALCCSLAWHRARTILILRKFWYKTNKSIIDIILFEENRSEPDFYVKSLHFPQEVPAGFKTHPNLKGAIDCQIDADRMDYFVSWRLFHGGKIHGTFDSRVSFVYLSAQKYTALPILECTRWKITS